MRAFGYADDIILLALCPFALRLMLKMCESFASSYGLQFNASKTQIIRFSLSPSNAQFCAVVSSLRFATLYIILDSISCMIYLTMRILFSDHVIFLIKQTNFFIILSSVLVH